MNLETPYLGIKLRTPLVASPSPLTRDLGNIRKLEDEGISAIVLHSLFGEQTTACRANYEYGSTIGPDAYLDHLAEAKAAVKIPLIASLNCASPQNWRNLARQIEQAGADALELNIYTISTDPDMLGSEVEDTILKMIEAARNATTLPLSVKLCPFFSNLANLVSRAEALDVDGFVFFNRFYQYDIDIERKTFTPGLVPSTAMDMRLPMHWISILYGRIKADLAATGGIHHGTDVVKMIAVGADVTMLCSALLQGGTGSIGRIEKELDEWMEQHGCDSLADIRGEMSLRNCSDASALERSHYYHALSGTVAPLAFTY